MVKQIETSLVIRRESIYAKIRRNLYGLMYGKDYKMIQTLDVLIRPKRPNGKIIIPKEIGKDITKYEKYKRL
ncbi:MAG: hypothetical protein HFJ34_01400 [Clostridia bacterium]|nr:hypothetical protein [Clostridia bacterium]